MFFFRLSVVVGKIANNDSKWWKLLFVHLISQEPCIYTYIYIYIYIYIYMHMIWSLFIVYICKSIMSIGISSFFQISTNSHTWPFFNKVRWAAIQNYKPTCTLKQSVHQILKKSNVTCFYLVISNLVIVSINNLQWSCLLIFSYIPCKQFMLERSSIEKLKFNHLNGVCGIFWF